MCGLGTMSLLPPGPRVCPRRYGEDRLQHMVSLWVCPGDQSSRWPKGLWDTDRTCDSCPHTLENLSALVLTLPLLPHLSNAPFHPLLGHAPAPYRWAVLFSELLPQRHPVTRVGVVFKRSSQPSLFLSSFLYIFVRHTR